MSKYHKLFYLVIIPLVIVAVLVNLNVFKTPLRGGTDVAGGMRVIMQADPRHSEDWPKDTTKRREKMDQIRRTVSRRIVEYNPSNEAVVQVQGDNRLLVEIPGVKDPDQALNQIKSTASLEFYYLQDIQSARNPAGSWTITSDVGKDAKGYLFTNTRTNEVLQTDKPSDRLKILEKVVHYREPGYEPILTGKDVLSNADVGSNPQTNGVVINIQFNNEGTTKFAKFTRDHVNDYLAIFYDNQLLTAPTIREAIPSGRAEVSGFSSLSEAKKVADSLNSGALPVPLKVIAKDIVQPTLGKEAIAKVLVAGVAGLALVVMFMLAYYRLPGLIASFALLLYTLFTLGFFRLMKTPMSLAGVAALIISIGMAVDANILIFERLKEELQSGKTLRAAIDAGFNRAFTAILDSNVCTAITSVILMTFGTPSVQSFGFTLLVGVAISMFTAITVTRTILHLLVGAEWAQNPKFYGLGTSWFSKTGKQMDIVGKRAWFYALSLLLIIPGIITLATFHLKPGIEFLSGTTIQARFKEPARVSDVKGIVESAIDKYTKDKGSEVQLGESGTNAFITVRLRSEDKNYDKAMESIRASLNDKYQLATLNRQRVPSFESTTSVGPAISAELTTNAFKAVLFASLLIALYLAIRFAIGGFFNGLKYGVCAVIALIHDALFILGLYAILGKVLGWETNSLFVTAVLTIIGFSVHDTIVVFDRIRENLRHRLRGETYEQLCNRSILQTFTRSINTSLTVVMTLSMLIILGGTQLREFYVTMLVGIIIGTYSSIFNATPLVVEWEKLAAVGAAPKKKAFEDKPIIAKGNGSSMVDQPMVAAASVDEAVEDAVVTDDADKKSSSSSAARIRKKNKRRF